MEEKNSLLNHNVFRFDLENSFLASKKTSGP